MADQARTPGESLRGTERRLGTTMRTIVRNYYKGTDLDTAQAIRQAESDTAAAEIVEHLRRGQASDVLLLALSAAAGARSRCARAGGSASPACRPRCAPPASRPYATSCSDGRRRGNN